MFQIHIIPQKLPKWEFSTFTSTLKSGLAPSSEIHERDKKRDSKISLEIEPELVPTRIIFSVQELLGYRAKASEIIDFAAFKHLPQPVLRGPNERFHGYRRQKPKLPETVPRAAPCTPDTLKASALYRDRWQKIDKLTIARQCFGLPGCDIKGRQYAIASALFEDAVIISLDFENGEAVTRSPAATMYVQMGVCILDTRDLPSTANAEVPASLLRTYNFSTIVGPRWKYNQFVDFIFGETISTPLDQFCTVLENLIDRSRNNFLVGHNVVRDLNVLKALGFDLETGISAVLDSQRLMRGLFLPLWDPIQSKVLLPTLSPPRGLQFHDGLQDLLRLLSIEHKDLHVGGNDAHFTMRALILLLVRDLHASYNVVEPALRARVHLLESIARSPLPVPAIPQTTIYSPPCYQIPSPFEPCVGRMEYEYISHANKPADLQREKVTRDIGFSEYLIPLKAWWRAEVRALHPQPKCKL